MAVSCDLQTTLRCPTCGAEQALSPACRRCKCDLSLLVEVESHANALGNQVLRMLKAGQLDEALSAAKQRCRLDPDEDAVRLLAVCHLRQGRFQAALDLCEEFRDRLDGAAASLL